MKSQSEGTYLESLVFEYTSLIQKPNTRMTNVSAENIITQALVKESDWSEEGAETLLMLVNDYGAFMLRNALALAVALNKEDGDKFY